MLCFDLFFLSLSSYGFVYFSEDVDIQTIVEVRRSSLNINNCNNNYAHRSALCICLLSVAYLSLVAVDLVLQHWCVTAYPPPPQQQVIFKGKKLKLGPAIMKERSSRESGLQGLSLFCCVHGSAFEGPCLLLAKECQGLKGWDLIMFKIV